VLVGVGTAFDDVEAAELMVLATRAAAADAGGAGLLPAVQRIVVPRGTWSYTDPARFVGDRIGAGAAETHLADIGIPQQTLINQVLGAVLAGELDIAVVVGAEAKARAARAAKRSTSADASGIAQVMTRQVDAGTGALETDQGGAVPDVHQMPATELVAQPEIDAKLWAPVEQYALMESALRAAERRSIPDDRMDIAGLWARFNEVAQHNPEAAFRDPMDAAQIYELGAHNRPLAFPYGKWHASQWTVDQAAALLICSAEAAGRHGVPRDRWIFPLVGVESSLAVPVTRRRQLHRWPAMNVLGRAAVDRIGHSLAECEHAEVYSCFPVAVRVQQRELGLDPDGTPTVTGGMAFAGGPFNSFVLHATAAIARRLREDGGRGLVTTVSGLLTKPGLAVWSDGPDGEPPLVADLVDQATAATEVAEVLGHHDGAADVIAYTVTYADGEPHELIAVADATADERVIAKSHDADLIEKSLVDELIGTTIEVAGNTITGA
jgi:acetyl-CoA C-acetyltransferase